MGASSSRATKAVVRSSAAVGASPAVRPTAAALQTSNESHEGPRSAPGKRAGNEGNDSPLELESMMLRLGGSVRTRTVEALGARPIPSLAVRAELREKRLQEAASRLRSEDVREVFRRRRDDGAAAPQLAAEYGVDAVLLERALGSASLPRIAEVALGTPPSNRRVATLEAVGTRGPSGSKA